MPESAPSQVSAVMVIVIIVLLMAAFVAVLVFYYVASVWVRAAASGVRVPFAKLVGMRLRRTPVNRIIDTTIRLYRATFPVDPDMLEAHYLAGGDMDRVADWLIAARAAGVDVTWEELCRLDLARRLRDLASVAGRDANAFATSLREAEQSAEEGESP